MTKNIKRRVPDPNKKLECSPLVYRTSTGLDFWFNYPAEIATSDPETSIRFVKNGGQEPDMFLYLRMGDFSMQIAQKHGKPFPPIVYRGPKFETTWSIGSLGVPLYLLKGHYRSLGVSDYAVTKAYEPVAVDEVFYSKKQQGEALVFITEALARYDGYWLGASRGKAQSANVYIRPELEKQLANGELLRK